MENRAKLVIEQRKRNEQEVIRAQLRRRLEQASFNVPGGRTDRILNEQLKQVQQQPLAAQLAATGGLSGSGATAAAAATAAADLDLRASGPSSWDGGAGAATGSGSSWADSVPQLTTAASPAPDDPASSSPFTVPATPPLSGIEAATSSPHSKPLQPRASAQPGAAAVPSLIAAALAPALNSTGVASPSYAASVASSSHISAASAMPIAPQQSIGRLPLLLARMSAAATSSPNAPGSPALPSHPARAAVSMGGGGGQGRGSPALSGPGSAAVAAASSFSPALAEPAPSVLRRTGSRGAHSTLRDVSSPGTTALPSPTTAPSVRHSINGLTPARPSNSGVGAASGTGTGSQGGSTREALVAVSATTAAVGVGSTAVVGMPRTSSSGYGRSTSVLGSAAFVGTSDAGGGADADDPRPPSRLCDASPLHPPRPPPLTLPTSQASLLQQLQQQPQLPPGEALPHHSCPGELVLPSPHSSAPSPASQAAARAALMLPRRSYHNLLAGALFQGPGSGQDPGLLLGNAGSSPGGAVGAAGSRVSVPPLRPTARSRAQSDCGGQAQPVQSLPSTPGAAAPDTASGELKVGGLAYPARCPGRAGHFDCSL